VDLKKIKNLYELLSQEIEWLQELWCLKSHRRTLTNVTEEIVQEQLKEDESHIITRMGNGYIQIDGQLYKENNIPPALQGYVQNEEQSQSSKWSSVKKNEEVKLL